MARQFVYHMQGLSKTWPGSGKKVLDNVHLSFYPDAKIGVLGVNGSGKSTLLKIMAGFDTEYSGEAWVAEGARVGYLPQRWTGFRAVKNAAWPCASCCSKNLSCCCSTSPPTILTPRR